MSSNSGPSSWTRPGFPSSNSSAHRRPVPPPPTGLHHNEMGTSTSGIESVCSSSGSSQEAQNCETICHMLKMLSCSDAHRALLAITSSPESCQSLRRAGCIPLLIQIMHPSSTRNLESHPSAETKTRAARALKNIVHFNPDEKMKRKEIRVLRLLETIRQFAIVANSIASSSSSSSPSSTPHNPHAHPTSSCTALMKLSFDEEHRNIMCTLGAIHALADLIISDHKLHGAHMELTDSTDSSCDHPPPPENAETVNFADCITIRRYSCMTLTNLTFGDGVNKALLCSMTEFLHCLVAQLGFQRNEDVVQVTASVLRNLSWHASGGSRVELQSSQAVPALMAAALRATKESTLKATLSALWNLSAHSAANKAAICSTPNALQFLVSLLRPDHHHPFYQQLHHQNQGQGQVPGQSQGPFSRPFDKSMTIIENAGGILRNVSSHIGGVPQYRKILREAHSFEVLLSQLRSSSLTVVSNACGTLWNLSGQEEEKRRLLELNAMPMLKSLRFSKDERISQAATATLRNLLAYFDQQQQIQQQQQQQQLLQHQKLHRSLDLETDDQNAHHQKINLENSQDSHASVDENAENSENVDVEEEENGLELEDEDDEQPLDLTITSCKSSPIRKLNPPPFLNPPITYNGSVSATRSCPDIQVKQNQNPNPNPNQQHQNQNQNQSQSQSMQHHQHHHVNSHSRQLQVQSQSQSQHLQATPKLEGSSDETFNYSLNYDEEEDDNENQVEDLEEEELEEEEKHDPEQKDSVRTFAEEGTPRFSNGGSMVDLTVGGIGMGMGMGMGGQQMDTCIQFQVEDTPAVFSRTSSLSSIDNGESGPGIRTPMEKIDKISTNIKKPETLTNNPVGVASTSTSTASPPVHSSISINPNPIPNPTIATPLQSTSGSSSQIQIQSHSHSHSQMQAKRVMFSAEETPLVFSRCSSVGSLESCGDLINNGGRESDCVSEFSRRTSEVVSPSDLPDSPRECKPVNSNQTYFKIPETGEAGQIGVGAGLETEADEDKKKTVTTDELKVFAMEGTPFLISNATSLSDIVGEFLESNNPSQEKPLQEQQQQQEQEGEGEEEQNSFQLHRENQRNPDTLLQREEERLPKPCEKIANKTETIETNAANKKKVPIAIKESIKEEENVCVTKPRNPEMKNQNMTENTNNHNDVDDEDDPIYSDVQLLQKCIRAGRQNFAPILSKKKTDNIMTATYTIAVLGSELEPEPEPEKIQDKGKTEDIDDDDDNEEDVDLSNLIQRGRAKLISMTAANANANTNSNFASTIPTKIPVPISMTTTRSNDNLKKYTAKNSEAGNTRKINNTHQSDLDVNVITEKVQSVNLSSPRHYDSYILHKNQNQNQNGQISITQAKNRSPENQYENENDNDNNENYNEIDIDDSSQDVTTAILLQQPLLGSEENDFDPNCPSDMTTTPTPMMMTESASISISASDTWTDDTPSFSSMSIPSMSISKAMSRVVKAEKIDTLSDIEQPTLLESRSNSLMSSSHRNPTTNHNHSHSHTNTNTHSHHQQNNKHFPINQAQKQLLQSSMTCSSSQMSNLINQKPPAEFFDLELESSMISVASIKSEIFDDASLLVSSTTTATTTTTNQLLQMPNNTNNNSNNNIMIMSNNVPNTNSTSNNSNNNTITINNNNADILTIPIPTSASSQIPPSDSSQATNNNTNNNSNKNNNNLPSTSNTNANTNKSDDSNSNSNSPSKYDTYVIKRVESSSNNSISNSNTNSPKDRRRNERYMTRTIEKFDLRKCSSTTTENIINTRTIEQKERIKPSSPAVSSSSSAVTVNNPNVTNSGLSSSTFVNVRPTRASELRANANNNNNNSSTNNSSRSQSQSRENSPTTKRSKTPTKIVSLPVNTTTTTTTTTTTENVTDTPTTPINKTIESSPNNSIMTTTLPRNTKLMEGAPCQTPSTCTSTSSMKRMNMTVSSSTGGLSTVLHHPSSSSSTSIPTSMSTDRVSYSGPVNSISSPSIAHGLLHQHQPQILSMGGKEEQTTKQHGGNKLMNFGGRLGIFFRKSFIHSPNKNLSVSSSSSSTTTTTTIANSSTSSVKRMWGRKKDKKQKEKEKAFVTPFNYKPPPQTGGDMGFLEQFHGNIDGNIPISSEISSSTDPHRNPDSTTISSQSQNECESNKSQSSSQNHSQSQNQIYKTSSSKITSV